MQFKSISQQDTKPKMKTLSVLLLTACIFAGVEQIYAEPKAKTNPLGKKVAGNAVDIIKDKINAFKLSLSEDKEIHPVLKEAAKYIKPQLCANEDIDVSCISGFNDRFANFLYKMEHNIVLDECQTVEGKSNKFCIVLPKAMSEGYAIIIDMVKLTMEYCKNKQSSA
ncbi:hypothetical protein FF38_08182 [Lucilia cuprina]|uniref:Uncharacterized protein n=1 Tax=Lucilia cuprina TaxID=7375 RepID=A0A0L0C0R5_LUCCU|nr:hypothetical protein FF38_08182 [Lucilia cuprina]